MLTVVGAVLASVAVLRSDGPAGVAGPGLAAMGLAAALAVTGWLTFGTRAWANWLILLAPIAPGVLAGGICLVALRTAQTRRAMSELVASLSSPERSLRVTYAIPGSTRWVDAAGADAPEDGAGLVLSDESGPALRIELAPGTHQAELLAELTPAARLALRNAQLAAAANARLIDVHASQRRIIATSDGERHRIERDLHDGAQQRLVSALVQLQLVPRPTAAEERILTETDHRLRAVLTHLRRLDLDPFPETLGTEGLATALEDLVADSAAPVTLNVSLGQVPDEIGRAIYALAAATLAWVDDASMSAEAALDVVQQDGSVRLRAEVSGMAKGGQPSLVEATDRIGSVGGQVRLLQLFCVWSTLGRGGDPVRVVVADDIMLIRSGLARLLGDAGVDVVGEAGDAATLLRLVALEKPDVAVVDIRMPPTHTDEGLRAARQIRDSWPDTAVVVLSQYLEPRYAQRLLADQPGHLGYLLKERVSDIAVLIDAMRRVSEGECVLDPTIVARLMQRRRPASPISQLTGREREILALMAEGRSNAGVAELLGISERTVETSCASMFRKLGLEPAHDTNRRVSAVLTMLRA